MEPEEISDEVWLSLNYPKVVFDDPVIKQMFITQLRKLERFEQAKKQNINFKPYRLLSNDSFSHNGTQS